MGMLSGIGSTIAQGMAFGTGSAMAHQAVGAAVGAVTGGGSDEIPRDAIMDGGVQQQAMNRVCRVLVPQISKCFLNVSKLIKGINNLVHFCTKRYKLVSVTITR